MILALWIAVTDFRRCARAYSNANFAIRRDARAVITLILSTTPGAISCSIPQYRSSVFSRTTIRSTLLNGVCTPAKFIVGRTLAYRSKVRRRCTLIERHPSATRVSSGPLSATRVRLSDSISASGTGVPKRRNAFIPAACRSHSSLIPVASITASAALTTSGPTPSPGIKVTARPPAEDVRPVFREGVAFIVFFTVLNVARTSSPLPARKRIEGEGPYTARSFARDSRFWFCLSLSSEVMQRFLRKGEGAGFDHSSLSLIIYQPHKNVADIGPGRPRHEQPAGRLEKVVRIVARQRGRGADSRALAVLDRSWRRECARSIGWAVDSVGPREQRRDSAPGPDLQQLDTHRERALLGASALAAAAHRDHRLTARDDAHPLIRDPA